MSPDTILEAARSVFEKESSSIAALSDQLNQQFVDVAYALLNCRGHVLVTGSGTSHAVAARTAHLLTCCGTPALFIHPGDSQHGLAGAVTANDVLIAISKGGETVEVNYLAEYAKTRGAVVIAFSEKPDSTLGRISDHVLEIHPAPDVDPYGMIATGSSITVCGMADALCVVLLALRGYTQEAFGQTHPGGAVGRALAAQGKDNR